MESVKTFFSRRETLALIFIYAVGCILRWLNLDVRPVHHDESLHLMYGRYYYDWPDIQFYKYDAMLHGPLIYTMLRVVYTILGTTTWAGRAFTAFLGTIFSFLPVFFRRFFKPTTVVVLAAAFSWSPTLIYWSRFIREDTIQLATMLIVIVGILLAAPTWKGIVTGLGVALVFCGKENSYVTVALLIGLAVYEWLFWFFGKKQFVPFALSIYRYIRSYPVATLLGVMVAAFTYSYFYSAGFRYDKGILDGLYRKSLMYWWDQHSKERISGPFLFHFYVFAWYEVAFLAAAFVQLFFFYKSASRPIQLIGGGLLLVAIGTTYAFWGTTVDTNKVWSLFKLKGPIEILGLFILLAQPVLCTTQHLLRNEIVLARWGYFFWASFFSYCYLGEKVPWLSVYILVPGIIYLALYFESKNFFASIAEISWASLFRISGSLIMLLGIIFIIEAQFFVTPKVPETWVSFDAATLYLGLFLATIGFFGNGKYSLGSIQVRWFVAGLAMLITWHHAILTNFSRAGESSEYLSQVHTTKDFQDLILSVRKSAEVPLAGYRPQILADGESTWPVTWYLTDIPQYKFTATPAERANFDYLFVDYKAGDAIPDGFCGERINLRGWWVPDFGRVTFKGFTRYMLNHYPWNDTGYSYVTFLSKNANWQHCARQVN